MRLILPVIIVLIAAALILAGCDPSDFGPSDRFQADIHYTLKPADRLSVENFNGVIEISGWDEPSIEVTGVKYASAEENLNRIRIDVHESPAVTEIRTVHPDTFHGGMGARYLIRVPRKTVLDRIVSGNGAIRVSNVSGGANAETSNGAIELDSVSGNLALQTSNGRIRADDVTGQCDARTSNGPVTLRFKDTPEGPVRVHTSNGSVELSLTKTPKSNVRLETSNGSITLNLPPDTAARLNAQTSNASVASDFDVAREKHHMEGNIGAGGPLIDLTTSNGRIMVHRSAAGTN